MDDDINPKGKIVNGEKMSERQYRASKKTSGAPMRARSRRRNSAFLPLPGQKKLKADAEFATIL